MRKFALSTLMVAGLATAGCSLTPEAFAQAPTPPAAADQHGRGSHHMGAPRQMSDRIDARLAYVKTALKITPAQEGQWNTVAEVVRQQVKAMDAERTAAHAAHASATPVSAIERLQQHQKMMSTMSTRLNAVITAAQPLYATFTDEQKKTADEMLSRGRGMRGGGMGGHHGRWH
jgi:predicted Zn-dependent protease